LAIAGSLPESRRHENCFTDFPAGYARFAQAEESLMLLDNYSTCVSLELLDADQVHSLQNWTFDGLDVITVGRADEQNVSIVNPHVSRLHLELRLDVDGWRVKSLGRHGVLLDGEKIDDALLKDRCILQLGTSGPSLRFILGRPVTQSGATMCEESSQFAGLQLDHRQKLRDVEAIAGNDYFQTLKERADKLRGRRR
jgi:hypothetical protein